jgi:folate-dependent phosphoribosylglycinamide formyltransferase PurN
MRIAIIAQEEPVCFGPFLRRVMEARAREVVCVAIAGSRGAGSHPRTLGQRLADLQLHWLLMEPAGFCRSLVITLGARLVKMLGLTGSRFDRRSVTGMARTLGIPVLTVSDVNSPEFMASLKGYAPDVIINQSERLLKKPLLELAPLGVVNRHGSLLPRFRGRLASFRGHAAEPPEYGVTIHLVDEGLDSGPIILQRRLQLDPRLPYFDVLQRLFRESVTPLLEALDLLARPGFVPTENRHQGTPVWPFPTLEEVRRYRQVLALRRRVHY